MRLIITTLIYETDDPAWLSVKMIQESTQTTVSAMIPTELMDRMSVFNGATFANEIDFVVTGGDEHNDKT